MFNASLTVCAPAPSNTRHVACGYINEVALACACVELPITNLPCGFDYFLPTTDIQRKSVPTGLNGTASLRFQPSRTRNAPNVIQASGRHATYIRNSVREVTFVCRTVLKINNYFATTNRRSIKWLNVRWRREGTSTSPK